MLLYPYPVPLRPIPTRPIWSRPTAIVGRLESADWVSVEILNMFDNMESRPTIVKSVVESADSGIESADSSTDSENRPVGTGLIPRGVLYTTTSVCKRT